MPICSSRARLEWLLILPAFSACAGGVRYSGDSQRALLDPARLGAGPEAPAGQRRLGEVSADCTLADATGGFEGVLASDLACSPVFLRAALRERAAAQGGTFLVDMECDPAGDDMPAGTRRASCSAEVWGPRDPVAFASAPPALDAGPLASAAPSRPPLAPLDDAWRVQVDYWPAPASTPRAPVTPEQVGEIDFPRVGYARLGDVRARADAPVSVFTLRAALRAAAARAGATSVVAARCVEAGGGQLCIASIAGLHAVDGVEPAAAEVASVVEAAR